jgi:hypothetical protein
VRARRRVAWLDHLVRSGTRYDPADGGRLAAAVTDYTTVTNTGPSKISGARR